MRFFIGINTVVLNECLHNDKKRFSNNYRGAVIDGGSFSDFRWLVAVVARRCARSASHAKLPPTIPIWEYINYLTFVYSGDSLLFNFRILHDEYHQAKLSDYCWRISRQIDNIMTVKVVI